jgi:hypothetical protein
MHEDKERLIGIPDNLCQTVLNVEIDTDALAVNRVISSNSICEIDPGTSVRTECPAEGYFDAASDRVGFKGDCLAFK